MTRARLSALAVVAALGVLTLGLLPVARADGDPASDWLYVRSVFVPFNAESSTAAKRLVATVGAARKAGFPIKVALIGGPDDLGSVPELFAKPERYAHFLGLELSYLYKGRLLIVMPNGFGLYQFHNSLAKERTLLRPIRIGQGVDGLAASGIEAVTRLAAAQGVHVPSVTVPGSASSGHGSSTSRDRMVIAAAAVGAALFAAAFMIWRRRRPVRPG